MSRNNGVPFVISMNSEKQNIHNIPVHRIIRRYLLFQIPGILILIIVSLFFVYVVEVPAWTIWLLIGAWVVKEAVTVPFTWRLYVRPRLSPTELMVDQYAVVAVKLDPDGYVNFHSELWEAEAVDTQTEIPKGETVRIKEIRGMRLIVERVS